MWLVQGDHSLSGEGLGQPDAVAGGLADVGVVHEPVDGGGGECFGHELVESGRVKIARHGHAAPFVGGVCQAVEPFGGIGADRQQPYVINLCGYPHRSIYADPATMPRVPVLGTRAGVMTVAFFVACRLLCRHSSGLSAASG